MANYNQAPKLVHDRAKMANEEHFYKSYPQTLMDKVNNGLSGKEGNAIKLMWILLGTSGKGDFQVSDLWVQNRTGMSHSSYIRARSSLIEKGWIKLKDGSLFVDIDAIMGTKQTYHDDTSKQECCDDTSIIKKEELAYHHEKQTYYDDTTQTYHDNTHNNKDNNNNNKPIETISVEMFKHILDYKMEEGNIVYIPSTGKRFKLEF